MGRILSVLSRWGITAFLFFASVVIGTVAIDPAALRTIVNPQMPLWVAQVGFGVIVGMVVAAGYEIFDRGSF